MFNLITYLEIYVHCCIDDNPGICILSYIFNCSLKCKITSLCRYCYTPIRMAKIKKINHTKYKIGYKELELMYTAGGNIYWYNHFGRCFVSYFKNYLLYDQTSIPGHFPQRNERICLYKDLYTNIHSSFIFKSSKLKTTLMPISS